LGAIKTDNSFLQYKIKLREENLPKKNVIKILDCFAGGQVIWNKIKGKNKNINFEIVSIDRNAKYRKNYILVGDNLKYMAGIDMSKYDIIDLDAYGVPYAQLKIIFSRNDMKGKIIFATFIMGKNFRQLPYGILKDIGIPINLVKKIPTLFNRNKFEKFCTFLALNKIEEINYYHIADKYYIAFNI
jgi:hypothetical protein